MFFAQGKGLGRIVVLSCERGDNVWDSIQKCLEENNLDNAVILSGVATFDRVNYHYVENTDPTPKESHITIHGAFEIANMDGFILHRKPHIHFTAFDHGKTIAAHLEPDTTALYVAEIVIAEILDLDEYHRISYPDAEIHRINIADEAT